MQNYIQPGCTVTLAAPYTVAAGAGALVGSLFGVALSPVVSGAAGEFKTTGVFTLAKTSAEAWTPGVKLYWDNATKTVTIAAAAGANQLIGCALLAAANPSSTGVVRLNGTV